MSENRHIFLKEILFQEGFNDGRYFNYSDVMELKEVYERFEKVCIHLHTGAVKKSGNINKSAWSRDL